MVICEGFFCQQLAHNQTLHIFFFGGGVGEREAGHHDRD